MATTDQRPAGRAAGMTAGRPMGPREWVMLIALAVLWSGSFLFNGIAVRSLPPFTIVWLRVTIAALCLLGALPLLGLRLPTDRASWSAFARLAALNCALPFALIVWGQRHIPSGLAAILNATTPLFGVVVAHLLTADERATPHRAIGVLVGFAGVALMIGPDAFAAGGHAALAGELACLAAACSYACGAVYGRRFGRLGIKPMVIATGQVVAASALLAPFMLVFDRPWTLPAPPASAWEAVAALGILSSAVAYALFFRILASAGATNVQLVTFLIPIGAILLGVALLGETLQTRHLIGMGVIGVALLLIDGRVLRRAHPARPKPVSKPADATTP